jgi:hypothetical protein
MVAEKDDDDALLWEVVGGKRERNEGALDRTAGELPGTLFFFARRRPSLHICEQI